MNNTKIKTAVFPVAGLGTRFLPITKASPKEMLTVIDRPLIDYAVQEAVAAGITQLIFVTSGNKRAIEDYFDSNFELETRLQASGKDEMLHQVRNLLPSNVRCVYIRQAQPRGLGDAILTARDVLDGEPFAVLLADDMIAPNPSNGELCLSQMVDDFMQKPCAAMVGVTPIEAAMSEQYGVVKPAADVDTKASFALDGIVEKPKPNAAPSSFGVVGRYILTTKVFDYLQQQVVGAGGEIQLTDAIASLMPEQTVRAHPIAGKRYDCGSKLGYLEAVLAYASADNKLGADFKRLLAEYAKQK